MPSFFADILAKTWDGIWGWWGLAWGAVLPTVFSFAIRLLRERKAALNGVSWQDVRWWLFGACLAVLCIVGHAAWQRDSEAQAEIARIQGQIARLTTMLEDREPKLVGKVDQVIAGIAPNKKVALHVTMSITNEGAASVADGFAGYMTISGKRIRLRHFRMRDGTSLGKRGAHPLVLLQEDSLVEKVIANKVARGDKVRGWLEFLFDEDVNPDGVVALGNVFEVEFTDYRPASKYYAVYPMDRPEGFVSEPQYSPGSGGSTEPRTLKK